MWPGSHGEAIAAPDLVTAQQIDVNRRKPTLPAVRRTQFSPSPWREGHTHVLFWFRDGARCESERASVHDPAIRGPHRLDARSAAQDASQRPLDKGTIMKIIAKVIESMLRKDATQTWTGQTSAVASRDVWGWGGISE
jgi:hypothetical protein